VSKIENSKFAELKQNKLWLWINGCMDVSMYGCMDVWMYGCMDVWMYGCMYMDNKCPI
jgi:hypothetical protein